MEEPLVYIKIYEMPGEVLVAACDKDMLGKSFSEGELKLDVSENFYGGYLASVSEALRELSRATIANLVGETIVSEAIKAGLVHEEAVIRICNIPHAQIVRMP